MARDSSFQKKWASDPIQIESPPDDVIASGWVGGAQGRLPEAKWENWWHKRADNALGEIETDGALQWFAGVPYKIGATVRLDESNWIAAKPSAGISPVSAGNSGYWLRLAPKSTTSVIGPVELATQEEAAAGEDGERAVTPSGLSYALGRFTYNKEKIDNLTRDATTSIKGVSRYASSAETIAGAVVDASVTPAGLAALTATSSRRGLIETATPQEVVIGTDGERSVTPAGLAGLTATTTRRGLVELATSAETSGTSAVLAVTPAGLNARDATKTYTSSDLTITPNSPLSLTHGLGVIPKSVQLLLICQTAELGYSPGDVVDVSGYQGNSDSAASSGITMKLTTTAINARVFSSFYVGNFNTGGLATATAANWRLRIRVFS